MKSRKVQCFFAVDENGGDYERKEHLITRKATEVWQGPLFQQESLLQIDTRDSFLSQQQAAEITARFPFLLQVFGRAPCSPRRATAVQSADGTAALPSTAFALPPSSRFPTITSDTKERAVSWLRRGLSATL